MKLRIQLFLLATSLVATSAADRDAEDPTTGCDDLEGWFDKNGAGCEWYERNDSMYCPNYGGGRNGGGTPWRNGGRVKPREACCWCGGGTRSPDAAPVENPYCDDFELWYDKYGDGCEWYEVNDSVNCPDYGNMWANPKTGVTAVEACCYCGGGTYKSGSPEVAAPVEDPYCDDFELWYDKYGDGCEWYEVYDPFILYCEYEWANPKTNVTAVEACCYCGGGTYKTGSPPPPPCSDFTSNRTCNREEGCAWRKKGGFQGKKCYESLDQATCEQWVDKMKKCEMNGCKYKKRTGACNARWPS